MQMRDSRGGNDVMGMVALSAWVNESLQLEKVTFKHQIACFCWSLRGLISPQ